MVEIANAQLENTLVEEKDNGIVLLTINRPNQLNALNIKTLSEIESVVDELYSNDSIKGLIITGSGDKSFVAGADITEFQGFNSNQGEELSENGHRIFNKIENAPKPIIAAINGYALGGGCELALACHLRVASSNAMFGQPEVKLGIIPGYGGTQRLVSCIGKTKGMELLMTGSNISAEEALNLGLVNYVVPSESLLDETASLLGKVLKQAPFAIKKIIECVNAYFREDINGLEYEINAFADCCNTSDFREGTAAFVEKRKPSFTGH